MPLLLLLPLLILAIVALWALLLPISLIQRYRFGRKRRRVQGWVVSGKGLTALRAVAGTPGACAVTMDGTEKD